MAPLRASLSGTLDRFDTPSVPSSPWAMPPNPRPARPAAAAPGGAPVAGGGDAAGAPSPGTSSPGRAGEGMPAGSPSLATLGIAGVSRRRLAWSGLAAAAAWIVFGFAGQAADAARATTRVAEEQVRNVEVAAETTALRQELDLVAQERWILQQARAYQLGTRKERPFALAPDAPPLAPDAPGSAARRLGADTPAPSPLEAWLEVLFGPQR